MFRPELCVKETTQCIHVSIPITRYYRQPQLGFVENWTGVSLRQKWYGRGGCLTDRNKLSHHDVWVDLAEVIDKPVLLRRGDIDLVPTAIFYHQSFCRERRAKAVPGRVATYDFLDRSNRDPATKRSRPVV